MSIAHFRNESNRELEWKTELKLPKTIQSTKINLPQESAYQERKL